MKLSVYRFDPDKDERPYMKDYEVTPEASDRMLLDVLVRAKVQDDSLSFRRSCREGVCGSDAMNINGKNGLACITRVADLPQHVTLRPLPGLPVIHDLEDPYRLFRCHTIMNCVDACPKNLNPTRAINKIKELLVKRAV